MDVDPEIHAERLCEEEPYQSVNGFIPNVLRRILSFVHPADQVLCKSTYWLLASAASQEQHYRVAVPKHGMLIMQWPVCLHRSNDIVRHADIGTSFVRLLRYNIDNSGSLIKENTLELLQTFLAGCGEITLDQISRSLYMYADVTTLLIGLYSSESYLPEFCRRGVLKTTDDEKQFRSEQLLFVGWKKWAQTIATVMDECASSLLHLIYKDDVACAISKLPDEFYVALKFDGKLAKMRNLQTLYWPTLAEYERACNQANPDSCGGWSALHALPATERLPNLSRVVFLNAEDSFFLTSEFTFPVVAARGVLMEINYAGELVPRQSSYLQAIFPEARIVSKRSLTKDFYFSDKTPSEVDSSLSNSFSLVESYANRQHFIEGLVKSVKHHVADRAESWSAWNHVHALTGCIPIPEKVVIDIDLQMRNGGKVDGTLTCLLGRGVNSFVHLIRQIARVRVCLNLDDDDDSHLSLYSVLPLFDAVHHPDTALPADAVKRTTLYIVLNYWQSTLASLTDSIQREFGDASCTNSYTMPTTTIFLCNEFFIPVVDRKDGEYDSDDSVHRGYAPALFDLYLTAVETKLTKIYTELLNDAVDSCRAVNNRRGLKFSMYQALEDIRGLFTIGLPEFVAEAFGLDNEKFESDCVVRLEQFRQRIWNEMFSLSGSDASEKPEEKVSANVRAGVDGVLPFPLLKSFAFDWEFY